MTRALFFGEVSNFIDFVEPMCVSGVERARLAVDAAKANKMLLARVLDKYVEHARVAIRDENVTLDQALIDAVIPEPAPRLAMEQVTEERATQALRMIRRIDGLVDALRV
jgi:hypothetical protein